MAEVMTALKDSLPEPPTLMTRVTRMVAWSTVFLTFIYLANVYLTYWQGFPGVLGLADGQTATAAAIFQLATYGLAFVLAIAYVMMTDERALRTDSDIIAGYVTFIIRAAFWAVLLVGLADAFISFLRVEGLLATVFGPDLETELGRSRFRGPYVHMPLVVLAIVIAALTRGLGFIWLGLLVAGAELLIVISRFVFSYEQAFQGDLVRFWYAALFLFASAYTLVEEGHVRVDVFYASLTRRTKGVVNYVGSLFMGIIFCWVVLALGTWSKSAVIVSPFLSFEVSQSGFGMYVKYLMAAFLGIFAVSMMLQFASYLLQALADARGDPGAKDHADDLMH